MFVSVPWFFPKYKERIWHRFIKRSIYGVDNARAEYTSSSRDPLSIDGSDQVDKIWRWTFNELRYGIEHGMNI